MAEREAMLFGELLVRERKIARRDLDKATDRQQFYHRPIGEILVMMGCVSPEDVKLHLLWQMVINTGLPFAGRIIPPGDDNLLMISRRPRMDMDRV